MKPSASRSPRPAGAVRAIPAWPEPVDPPSDQPGPRPFWSVMVPTYNGDVLLAETLASVLAQDPGPEVMQIEVVDDASTTGDPERVVRDLAGDRVEFFRQPRNQGAPATFTTCIERARGRWVHILHGDDLVMPGFYDAYRSVIDRHDCAMVVGPSLRIDGAGATMGRTNVQPSTDGLLDDPIQTIVMDHAVDFASVVVARWAYERVGGFHTGLVHANDWHMWTRLALLGDVGYVTEPLARYRRHDASDTTRLRASSAHIHDALTTIDLIADQLDDERAATLRVEARQSLSRSAWHISRSQARGGHVRPALVNASWAARLHPSPTTVANVPRVLAVAAARRVRPATGR